MKEKIEIDKDISITIYFDLIDGKRIYIHKSDDYFIKLYFKRNEINLLEKKWLLYRG